MSASVLSAIRIIEVAADAINGPGVVSAVGVKAGDIIITAWVNEAFGVFDVGFPAMDKFSPVVTVDDEINQTTGESMYGKEFKFVLLRTT